MQDEKRSWQDELDAVDIGVDADGPARRPQAARAGCASASGMSSGRMLPRAFGQIPHPNQLASHIAGPHGGAAAQARLGGGGASDRYLDQFEERRQDENWLRLASD
eukprot:COSAG06_NODE_21692_length_748_cov_1.938367_1_plen_105_part_10